MDTSSRSNGKHQPIRQCPICRTPLNEESFCAHCQTDLTSLTSAVAAATDHQAASIRAFINENPDDMLLNAKSACSEYQTTDACKILACAALLAGDHALALKAWRRLQTFSKKSNRRSK